jgi:hypothetical protein
MTKFVCLPEVYRDENGTQWQIADCAWNRGKDLVYVVRVRDGHASRINRHVLQTEQQWQKKRQKVNK